MICWRAFHVYYSEVDRLILECVHPFLEERGNELERRFWERHFAGGAHLRIQLGGSRSAVDRLSEELVERLNRFLTAHPSPDVEDYSATRAAALLELEGIQGEPYELHYRNNVWEEHVYSIHREVYASDAAAALAEEFRHDIMPLAALILRRHRPRREELLRLFFLHAIASCGNLPEGAVSWKSHWEGFAATFPSAELIQRIQSSYQQNRDEIRALMLEVQNVWDRQKLEVDPLLAGWRDLVVKYKAISTQTLAAGQQLTRQPTTPEEAARTRDELNKHILRDSSFVRRLWSNDRFLASMQFEPSFQVPRILVNLLYVLVAAAGLSPVDKHALCYFAHRSIEEHFAVDLETLLERTMARIVERHAQAWTGSTPAQPRA